MTRSLPAMLILAAICVTGCTGGSEPDFCKNHRLFHADHIDTIGVLTIELTADGTVHRQLQLPDSTTALDLEDEHFDLTFEDDGQLRQIDVSVFNLVPDLEEIEVTMTTPETRKHFAISRQCENPIFRLE